MDFIHMQIKSDAAKLPLPLDILVPREGDRRRFKTVYLLHDFGANNTQWMRSTRVEQLMEGLDTVLIMPSCLNSFYVDMYYGSDFFTYLSQELVYTCEHWLGLDPGPKRRVAAGVGMGGYGALHAALKVPEVFGTAFSADGMLNPSYYYAHPLEHVRMEDVFGPEEYFEASSWNLTNLIRDFRRNHSDQPAIKPDILLNSSDKDLFREEAQQICEELRSNDFSASLFEEEEPARVLAEKVRAL